jgi:hypothetical protein
VTARERATRARLAHVLDLFAEENRLNVYAGELEVRPPGAPTIGVECEAPSRRYTAVSAHTASPN